MTRAGCRFLKWKGQTMFPRESKSNSRPSSAACKRSEELGKGREGVVCRCRTEEGLPFAGGGVLSEELGPGHDASGRVQPGCEAAASKGKRAQNSTTASFFSFLLFLYNTRPQDSIYPFLPHHRINAPNHPSWPRASSSAMRPSKLSSLPQGPSNSKSFLLNLLLRRN
jgi:hypothetical protein